MVYEEAKELIDGFVRGLIEQYPNNSVKACKWLELDTDDPNEPEFVIVPYVPVGFDMLEALEKELEKHGLVIDSLDPHGEIVIMKPEESDLKDVPE